MTEVDGEVDVHPRNCAATYRAYHLDKAGRITTPAVVFEASDDLTAVTRAHALMGAGDQVEIWEGSRRVVATLLPEGIDERH